MDSVQPGILSRAIVRVLKQAVPLADPTAPADEIHVDTHNLGKLPTVWLSFECSDLQILCDRAGSRSISDGCVY